MLSKTLREPLCYEIKQQNVPQKPLSCKWLTKLDLEVLSKTLTFDQRLQVKNVQKNIPQPSRLFPFLL